MLLRKVVCTAALVLIVAIASLAADPKLSTKEVVSKHLDSLGSAEARRAVGVRMARGTVEFSDVVTGKIHLQGTAMLVSQAEKVKCAFQFGVPQYVGEQFVFDGHTHQVAMTDPGKRSNLGQYLFTQSEVLRDGLLGGALSTAWPLLDVATKQPKLKYEGLKKVDGRELHEVTYIPKKSSGSGDLLIRIYFEPETFRHVMTVYRLTVHNSAGSIQQGTDEASEIVEERFSDFHEIAGLTLPSHWQLRYYKAPSTTPGLLQWDVRFDSIGAPPQ